jgi:hypothetical protein
MAAIASPPRSCFGMRRLLFLCDQSIAVTQLGPDHAASCAQRPPDGRHLGLKIVFFDDDPGPDGIEELRLHWLESGTEGAGSDDEQMRLPSRRSVLHLPRLSGELNRTLPK